MHLLVIGNGISGMCCAIEAASAGDTVTLCAPYPSERAQSVMAAGGINGVLDTMGEGDTQALHLADTMKGGCNLENEKDVAAFVSRAPENIRWLRSLGTAFSCREDGTLLARAFGGQSRMRTVFAGASTGKQIVTALVWKCREYERAGLVTRKTGMRFHSALIRDGVCYGAVLWNTETDELSAETADAVVMATGGQNALFGKTTGSVLCDGYAAGSLLRAGVELRNEEFVQFHPTAVETPHKRMLITEAARGEGGRLFYLDGERRVYFMEDKYGPRGNLMTRDTVSAEMYACPGQVYLDITFLGKEKIAERLPEVSDVCKTYLGIDPACEPIPVSPAAHFFMGGIRVNGEHRTGVERLYAVGECASKYHGANRLGGNSLAAAVDSGRTAARAAHVLPPVSSCPDFRDSLSAAAGELQAFARKEGNVSVSAVHAELAACMTECMGVVRTGRGMETGLARIRALRRTAEGLGGDSAPTLYEAYRLPTLLTLAEAALTSALLREESRGAHKRSDFPETSDVFRKCSVVRMTDGTPEVRFVGEEAAV